MVSHSDHRHVGDRQSDNAQLQVEAHFARLGLSVPPPAANEDRPKLSTVRKKGMRGGSQDGAMRGGAHSAAESLGFHRITIYARAGVCARGRARGRRVGCLRARPFRVMAKQCAGDTQERVLHVEFFGALGSRRTSDNFWLFFLGRHA